MEEKKVLPEVGNEIPAEVAIAPSVKPLPLTSLTDSKCAKALDFHARKYANSRIVPEAYRGNPDDCFVACSMANRMNIDPLIVMQQLYIVKGKPGWSGQACISLVNNCGKFTPLEFTYVGTPGAKSYGCFAWANRKSTGAPVKGSTVTMELVEKEGWLDKPGSKWKTMPEQMLAYRAAAFFARLYTPEALMGFQTVEEINDVSGGYESDREKIIISMED